MVWARKADQCFVVNVVCYVVCWLGLSLLVFLSRLCHSRRSTDVYLEKVEVKHGEVQHVQFAERGPGVSGTEAISAP